jgi:hypothetical protein
VTFLALEPLMPNKGLHDSIFEVKIFLIQQKKQSDKKELLLFFGEGNVYHMHDITELLKGKELKGHGLSPSLIE